MARESIGTERNEIASHFDQALVLLHLWK